MSAPLSSQELNVAPRAHRLAAVKSAQVPQKLFTEAVPLHAEEEMIVDHRVGVRPAQMVENKLSHVMQGSVVGVSHLRLKSLLAQRSRT